MGNPCGSLGPDLADGLKFGNSEATPSKWRQGSAMEGAPFSEVFPPLVFTGSGVYRESTTTARSPSLGALNFTLFLVGRVPLLK